MLSAFSDTGTTTAIASVGPTPSTTWNFAFNAAFSGNIFKKFSASILRAKPVYLAVAKG